MLKNKLRKKADDGHKSFQNADSGRLQFKPHLLSFKRPD